MLAAVMEGVNAMGIFGKVERALGFGSKRRRLKKKGKRKKLPPRKKNGEFRKRR